MDRIWTIISAINKVLKRLLAFLLQVVWKYRRDVVRDNLKRVYPRWTNEERAEVETGFYLYLGGLIRDLLGSLWVIRKVHPQIQWENPELMESLALQNQSLVLLTSHYGNWEIIAQAMGTRFRHCLWFVYKPIQWTAIENWVYRWRVKRDVLPVAIKSLRTKLSKELPTLARPIALYLGADQSPTAHSRWMMTNFLGQPTAAYQGPEELCRTFGLIPVWLRIQPSDALGSYRIRFVLPEPGWIQGPHGTLMHWYMRSLTEQIHGAPQFWLWTHRRWKLNPSLGLDDASIYTGKPSEQVEDQCNPSE